MTKQIDIPNEPWDANVTATFHSDKLGWMAYDAKSKYIYFIGGKGVEHNDVLKIHAEFFITTIREMGKFECGRIYNYVPVSMSHTRQFYTWSERQYLEQRRSQTFNKQFHSVTKYKDRIEVGCQTYLYDDVRGICEWLNQYLSDVDKVNVTAPVASVTALDCVGGLK